MNTKVEYLHLTDSDAAPLPSAWFCVNNVTGKMLYTDSRDEATAMREQRQGHWSVTPLFAGEQEKPTSSDIIQLRPAKTKSGT